MRLFIFLMVIILASCKSTKRLGPMPDRSQFEITKALKDRNIDFDWFSGKMSTALESPDESVSGSMQIRMKKDSVMFVVVKKFGIEISRIQADKEGYTILYRWETAYETGPISQINEIISLSASFEDLQQLIFGNVLLPDDNSTEITKDSIYYVVSTKIDDLAIQYYVNGYSMELEKMSISDKMNRTAFAQYKDYRQVGQYGKIPFERTFTFPYSPSANATINMKFSELEINVPKEIKFSIPAHYEKIN